MKNKKLLSLALISAYLYFIQSILNLYKADIHYKSSERLLSKGEIQQAYTYANKAVEKNPNEPAYFRQRAKILLMSTLEQSDENKTKIKSGALRDLQYSQTLNPNNMATLRNNAGLYMILAVKDLSQPISPTNIDNNYDFTVKNYFNFLKQRFPNDAGIYVLTANLEKRLGFEKEYEQTKIQIKTLRPDLLEWHPDLQ